MDYEIIRSKRKTLAVEVKGDGRVIVRAPLGAKRDYIERFIASNSAWIERAEARQAERRLAHPEPSDEERAALVALARQVLPERTAYYAKIMGLTPTGITITGAKTRFGSCSPKNRISYSWRLMQYPEAAIDYVVVHELAHIVHKNHSKDFYALIERYLPDYKERIKLLR